jgi:PAS domain S-box-containing protein
MSRSYRYAHLISSLSALAGLAFPVIGCIMEMHYHGFPYSFESAVALHKKFLNLWLLDSAPLVMGLYGYFLGRALDKIHLELENRTESEQRLRSILNNLSSGVLVTDESGVIQKCNAALCAMFGFGEGELRAQHINVLMPPEVAGLHDTYLRRLQESGRSDLFGKRRELMAQRRDGKTFPIEIVIGEMKCADTRYFVGSITDISQRKQLEAQLHQAQRLESIGQLAAGVAHEINTPIQYVGDNLHVLRQNFEDLSALIAEFQRCAESAPDLCRERMLAAEERYDLAFILDDTPKAISQAIEGTERVSHIVRAMKDFSHIDRAKVSAVDINAALRNTLTIARNEYKYVADTKTLFADLPLVECYASELNQVFLNLIVNAAHAIADKGPERGLITLVTQNTGAYVQISIKDTGTGIPKAIQDRVFDPFFTTKEVGKGTGQGLHIAHQVVAKHGGRLWFESEPGQGTSFHIQIPLQLEQKATAEHA